MSKDLEFAKLTTCVVVSVIVGLGCGYLIGSRSVSKPNKVAAAAVGVPQKSGQSTLNHPLGAARVGFEKVGFVFAEPSGNPGRFERFFLATNGRFSVTLGGNSSDQLQDLGISFVTADIDENSLAMLKEYFVYATTILLKPADLQAISEWMDTAIRLKMTEYQVTKEFGDRRFVDTTMSAISGDVRINLTGSLQLGVMRFSLESK